VSGCTYNDVAYALRNAAGRGLQTVASILYYDLAIKDYSRVLGYLVNGIGGYYSDLINALYYGVGGIGFIDLAKTLTSVTGVNVATVALALWNMGAGLSTGNIVWVLTNAFGTAVWEAWQIVNAL
jgi:hypothetical protein